MLLDTLLTSSTQINFLTASAVPRNHPAASPGICVAANTYLLQKGVSVNVCCSQLKAQYIEMKIIKKVEYKLIS